jgi:hypothetical protein
LSLFLVPIPELQHAFLPPKCCDPSSVPQLFIIFVVFTFRLVVESTKEFGGALGKKVPKHKPPKSIPFA